MPKPLAYRDDLAYIHDAGFGDFARHAATFVIEKLRAAGLNSGRVVDLGCGSGILSAELCRAGYDVTGFDISAAMVALARRRAPQATFEQASFLDAELPECVAVTAIGEVFNYLFDARNRPARLTGLLRKIYRLLPQGGLLMFDVATVGREPTGRRRGYSTGVDWACLFEASEDRERKLLERRITSFRREGDHYRRDDEVHRLRLFERPELVELLQSLGFGVRTTRRYGDLNFPPGYLGIVARKR